ncbi:MAG: mechanosensitive ion channel [Alphaproteobacteria bacterium]|nr:mechanosensitive ion channel [Alphaproteobacteria bacterium]
MEVMGYALSQEMVEEWVFIYGLNLVAALLILVIGWIAAKITRKFAAKIMERARLEKILISFLSNIIYALVLAFVVIASLNKLGVQTASLIAVLGAAGLAIGLALQGSLSNFAAGVMIILFKHFKIGDFILGGGVTGTVIDMNVFTTTLNTPTNEKVLIPNSSLTGGPLTNYTGNDTRRIDHIIGVGYDDDLTEVREAIMRVLDKEERVLDDPAPFVGVDALADSSVNFVVRAWVDKSQFGATKCDLLENFKREFDRVGITIPYPQQDMHVMKFPASQNEEKKAS